MQEIAPNKVQVTKFDVMWFNKQWPGSSLRPSRSYWFEFAPNGDLIDTDCPESDDSDAASAIAQDCKAWLFNNKWPAWLPEPIRQQI